LFDGKEIGSTTDSQLTHQDIVQVLLPVPHSLLHVCSAKKSDCVEATKLIVGRIIEHIVVLPIFHFTGEHFSPISYQYLTLKINITGSEVSYKLSMELPCIPNISTVQFRIYLKT
jgi:hypothetical protein